MAVPSRPWSDAYLRTASTDNLQQLPEDEIHTLDWTKMDDDEAAAIVRQAQRQQKRQLDREAKGLPQKPWPSLFNKPKPKAPVVELVQRHNFEDFGFYMYRVNFDDDERWTRWSEEFHSRCDASLQNAEGGGEIMDRSLFFECNDITLKNMPWLGVHDYHHLFKQDNPAGPGIDHGVALAVDKDVIDALLEPKNGTPPWIWVMDEAFDFSDTDTIPDGQYAGHFPVAIDSLLTDLWPALLSGQGLRELWATCSFNEAHPIWTTAVPL